MALDYVLVYSTHCPKCNVLEKKLKMVGINYTVIDDQEQMIAMGLKSAPYLQVNCGELMDFTAAMKWIKEKENG